MVPATVMTEHVRPEQRVSKLEESRTQFSDGLGQRINDLQSVVRRLRGAPDSAILREGLSRRLQAMRSACVLLEYPRAAEAFGQCVDRLLPGGRSVSPEVLREVEDVLAEVPRSIARGSATEAEPVVRAEPVAAPVAANSGAALPAPVVALSIDPELRRDLAKAWAQAAMPDGRSLAGQLARNKEQALHWVRTQAPEVVVVDFSHPEAVAFVALLHDDVLSEPMRLILVVEDQDASLPDVITDFVACRVLAKPCSSDTLAGTFTAICRGTHHADDSEKPWNDLTVQALTNLLCAELRDGLEQAVPERNQEERFDLGSAAEAKASIWAALAKVRQTVVQASAGRVAFVDRDPTRGVPVVLAAEDSDEDSRGEGRSAASVSLKGRKIVVVDDDPAIAWFLSGALRKAGANVIEAHQGARALELIYQHWPDLVVSDILMPEIDGFALCRRLKSDLALSDTPVVLVSWKEDLLQRVRELGAGADGYLRKEASAPTVVRRACEVLRARARVENRIAASTTVMGRLDGLTPRLVLQLVCQMRRAAKVTFSEANRIFVLHIADGTVRAASATHRNGSVVTGEAALCEVLGMRVGRFEIGEDADPIAEQFHAPMRDLLEPALTRARALWRLFEPQGLAQIARIVTVEDTHVGALPTQCEEAFRALHAGTPPTQVVALHGGETLSRLLTDLTRRAAIRAVVGFDGSDLLLREMAHQRARQDELSAVPEFETPKPGDTLDVAASRSELPPAVEPTFGIGAEPSRLAAPTMSELTHRASVEAEPARPVQLAQVVEAAQPAQAAQPLQFAPPARSVVTEAPEACVDLGAALFSQVAASPQAPPVTRLASEPIAVAALAELSASASAIFASEPVSPVPAGRASIAGPATLLGLGAQPSEAPPRAMLRVEAEEPEFEQVLSAKPQTESTRDARWTEVDSPAPATVVETLQRALSSARSQGADVLRRAAALRQGASARAAVSGGSTVAKKALAGAAPTLRKAKSAVIPITLTLAVSGVTFGAVRLLTQEPDTAAVETSVEDPAALSAALAPQSSRDSAAAPIAPPTPAKPVEPSLQAVDMALPEGLDVGDGNGLLEINTQGNHKIYVAGVFVGAGPVRRVPVPAGEHIVEVRLDSKETSERIEVPAGRRVRVTLTAGEPTKQALRQ